jgi:pSer/pThr/pTyr-binding forkhead associated (FHA) protein
MDAQLIVVSGKESGTRFNLGESEFTIGRAPTANLRLADSGVAPEHCVVRSSANGYRVVDRHSGSGTYVNGMRVSECALQAEDQIAIGDTVLVYREAFGEPPAAERQQTLLQACSCLFLFRALAAARDEALRQSFEDQVLHLISGLHRWRDSAGAR